MSNFLKKNTTNEEWKNNDFFLFIPITHLEGRNK